MKYLKRFSETLDESSSNESSTEDTETNINDILLSLEDDGIYKWISVVTNPSLFITISLSSIDLYDLTNQNNKPFNITDNVIDTLRHLDSYLQSEGLKLSSISFRAKDRDSDMQNGGLQNDGAKTWEEFGEYLTRWGYHQFESLVIRYK